MDLGVVVLESDLKSLRLVNLTEVDNLQGLYPLKDEWIISCSLETLGRSNEKLNNRSGNGQKTLWTQQSTSEWLNKRKRWTLSCEGSGAAPGDTLNKALQTLFAEYYLLYFRRCENIMFVD